MSAPPSVIASPGTVGFAATLRHRSFAVLYAAECQSILGSQLARVALAVLVFQRTGSASATAFTYAATFVSAILGGLSLGEVGDRLPRPVAMIGCDVVRAAAFAAMALPGLPTLAIVGLLVLAVFVEPVFSAAEVSYLAAALSPEMFRAATGLRMIGNQVAQVAGFALGGVVVSAVGARTALVANALTFVISTVVIAVGVGRGSAMRGDRATGRSEQRHVRSGSGWAHLRADRQLLTLLSLSALAGLFVVPEGLAVPFTAQTGGTTIHAGILLATIPLGSAVGIVVLVRWRRPGATLTLPGWMAVGCGIPLVVTAMVASWPVAIVCWFVSGLLAAYQVEIMLLIVRSTPDQVRSAVVGIASAVLLGAQGLGLIAFGALSRVMQPSSAIGVAGAVGAGLALLLRFGQRTSRAPSITDPSTSTARSAP